MAYAVVFAPEAIEQLEALFARIADDGSPLGAERYTVAVIQACEGLALFTHRGLARPDIRPGLRLTHHRGRTVIAYAVDDTRTEVAILGIFHGGRDHEAILAGRAPFTG